MPIELVPLCTATVELSAPMFLPDTPEGTLAIVEVTGAVLEGERLRAGMVGRAAADWLRIDSRQLGTLDVRITLQTHDNALVYSAYRGRLDLSAGLDDATVYAAPLFNTGDDRYLWLNRIQAVAKGVLSAGGTVLAYEMHEVR